MRIRSGLYWSFGRILLVCILGVAPPTAAQTPDSQTPAEETVCSKLKSATPGLYGLCVAYCEAHDADFDTLTGMPLSGTPANTKILENYNKRKQASDPEMPCVKPVCPCFDAADLEQLDFSGRDAGCFDFFPEKELVFISGTGADGCKDAAVVQGPTCTYLNTSGPKCSVIESTSQKITPDEFKSCAELIRADATRRRLTCTVR